ncbi:MAG: fibronectin type III domain-containing protein [Candidatus Firestonebacteria bacterium]|nr:fibronectin type III domain-containing protein [Candidatus Firestonebacteria bacterium]
MRNKILHIVFLFVICILILFAIACSTGKKSSSKTENVPSLPVNLIVTLGNRQVSITWDPVHGAKSYNLYYDTGSIIIKAKSKKVENIVSPYIIKGLTNEINYSFAVTALNDIGESDLSALVSAVPDVSEGTPSKPSNIKALIADEQVTLMWDTSIGALSYNIYYDTGYIFKEISSQKIREAISPYVVNKLINGIEYAFAVTALNKIGESSLSKTIFAIPNPPSSVPSAPDKINAVASDGQVILNWEPVNDAMSYIIYYGIGTSVAKTGSQKINNIQLCSFVVSNLINGREYAFAVTAVNAIGESILSDVVLSTPNVVSGVPLPPIKFSAIAGDRQVALGWEPGSVSASYNVYYEKDDTVSKTSGTKIEEVTPPYFVTGLTNETLYSFAVTALNEIGESALSRIISATPTFSSNVVTVPINIKVIAGDKLARLSWDPVIGAKYYNLYYHTDSSTVQTKGKKIESVTSPYVVTRLTNSTKYAFGVTSVNDTGESKLSDVVLSTPGNILIAGGGNHSMAFRSDGTICTWGYNRFGQIGDGTLIDKNISTEIPRFGDVLAIAAGGNHSIALKKDGTVYTWGFNGFGQLGYNFDTTVPVLVSGLTDIIAVAAGWNHSIALTRDGTVWTWGNNIYGQLGNGSNIDSYNPVQPSLFIDVIAIAAGGEHSIVLKKDGTVWTWGGNESGQLGDGTNIDRNTPVQVFELTDIIAVAAGWSHSIALKKDGTVLTWGNNGEGQLGDLTNGNSNIPVKASGINDVISIAAGGKHSIALRENGRVSAWGDNSYGQLGITGLTDVIAIAGGWNHSLALKDTGIIMASGYNGYGQLGDGTNNNTSSYVQVYELPTFFKAVTSGFYHIIAVKNDSTLSSWGYNKYGQLGDSTLVNKNTLEKIKTLKDIVSYSAGGDHNIILKNDNTVYTWGRNNYGQLGIGNLIDNKIPVKVSGLTNVTAVAGGAYHSLILKNDSTVFACGDNSSYQLGDSTNTDRSSFVQVKRVKQITAVAGGGYHSLALKRDSTVYSWGGNDYYQLGDSTSIDRSTYVQVKGLKDIIAISAGSYHSIALKKDGTVCSWGYNIYGQLGDGSNIDRRTYVQVKNLTDIVAISAGSGHNLALKKDGIVYSWGDNSYGQLGDGTKADRNTYVQVSDLKDVIAIAAGDDFSVAIKNDGTIWAWGDNSYGQLGDGTYTDRLTPKQIIKKLTLF